MGRRQNVFIGPMPPALILRGEDPPFSFLNLSTRVADFIRERENEARRETLEGNEAYNACFVDRFLKTRGSVCGCSPRQAASGIPVPGVTPDFYDFWIGEAEP